MGSEPRAPEIVEATVAGVEVGDKLVFTPLPEEARRGHGRDGQETDTEDTDRSSRVEVHVRNLTIKSRGKFRTSRCRSPCYGDVPGL